MKRALLELLDVKDSAWPTVQNWMASSANHLEILPADDRANARALIETQVTTRSPMGAMVYHTGGVLVDHGWLRFLGSGHSRLPRSMPEWNQGRSTTPEGKPLGFWLIADDVVGGFFALNGGAFGAPDGKVFYFAPDTLRWESMNGMGYSEFLVWSLRSSLAEFYATFRWAGWEGEVANLSGNQAFSFYPLLCTEEGKDANKCHRKPIAISEIFSLNTIEAPNQLAGLAEGSRVRVRVSR